ncbi:hypothetical protein ACA590_11610 [Lactiplantibacillus plantarum]|uniref:hypothetical protein n=1 Tax=Lactiplantibacillus plantarum TaxID=1590 RepID=UPI003C20F00A
MKDFLVYYKIPLWLALVLLFAFQAWNFYIQKKLSQSNTSLKSALDNQQLLLKEQVENRQYTSQKRFDLEVEIYKELFNSLITASDDFSALMPLLDTSFPDEKSKKKEITNRWKIFNDSFNTFSKVRRAYAPFYAEEVRLTLNEISDCMMDQGKYFRYMHFMPDMKPFAQKHWSDIDQNNKNVRLLVNKATKQVSNHMKSKI